MQCCLERVIPLRSHCPTLLLTQRVFTTRNSSSSIIQAHQILAAFTAAISHRPSRKTVSKPSEHTFNPMTLPNQPHFSSQRSNPINDHRATTFLTYATSPATYQHHFFSRSANPHAIHPQDNDVKSHPPIALLCPAHLDIKRYQTQPPYHNAYTYSPGLGASPRRNFPSIPSRPISTTVHPPSANLCARGHPLYIHVQTQPHTHRTATIARAEGGRICKARPREGPSFLFFGFFFTRTVRYGTVGMVLGAMHYLVRRTWLRWEVPDGRSGQVGSCARFGDFASLASDEACGCEGVCVEDWGYAGAEIKTGCDGD